MALLFNMLSRLVITFLPRSKCLLISWLQSPSAPKYYISCSFVDCEGYSISSREFLPTVIDGKPLQHSCLENPMNSMKRQRDRTLKGKLPRSVGAQHTMEEENREEQRNSSRSNEEAEKKWKQHPVVDVSGGESKVRCCKEYWLGTWIVRSMNQGNLEVVKQEMVRVKIDILGITELKWTGMGEFNIIQMWLKTTILILLKNLYLDRTQRGWLIFVPLHVLKAGGNGKGLESSESIPTHMSEGLYY